MYRNVCSCWRKSSVRMQSRQIQAGASTPVKWQSEKCSHPSVDLYTWLKAGSRCRSKLHRASLTVYYYYLDTLAEKAQYGLFHYSCGLSCLYTVKLRPRVPCGYERMVTVLNCLLVSVNSTNETLFFVRFLFMCDFCLCTTCHCAVFSKISFCKHVQLSCVINTCLLTYLNTGNSGCVGQIFFTPFLMCRWAPASVDKSHWADSICQFYGCSGVVSDLDGQCGTVAVVRGVWGQWTGSDGTPAVAVSGQTCPALLINSSILTKPKPNHVLVSVCVCKILKNGYQKLL